MRVMDSNGVVLEEGDTLNILTLKGSIEPFLLESIAVNSVIVVHISTGRKTEIVTSSDDKLKNAYLLKRSGTSFNDKGFTA